MQAAVGFDAVTAAEVLRKAMKGIGTGEFVGSWGRGWLMILFFSFGFFSSFF